MRRWLPSRDRRARQVSGSSFYAGHARAAASASGTAMFAIYAFCREVDDIADEPGRTPDERRAALDRWRADLDALYAGEPAPADAGCLAEAGAPLRPARRTTSSPSSTAWRWTSTGHPRARLRRRSISIATASPAPSAGCRCRSSAWTDEPGRDARPPPRPRAAAHQHPARPRRGRRHRPALPAARGAGRGRDRGRDPGRRSIADPRVDAACRWLAAERATSTTARPTRSWRTRPPGRLARAAADERGLRRDPAARWRRPAGPPPRRARQLGKRAAALDRGPARPRADERSRRVYVVGAGLAGCPAPCALARRGRRGRPAARRRARPAGAAAPIVDPQLGMTIDNGNHLVLSGNHAAFALSATPSARRTGWSGPSEARVRLRRLARRRALDHPAQRRPARPGGCSSPAPPRAGHAAWPTTSPLAPLVAARRDRRIGEVDRCARAALGPADRARSCWRALNTEPAGRARPRWPAR